MNTNNTFTTIKKSIFGIATLAMLLGTMQGCKKDDDNSTTNTPSAHTIPPINDADGVLVAIRTQTTQTVIGVPVEFNIGTAVGVFSTTPGAANYFDVGTVTATVSGNDYVLTKQSNNSYIYTPSQSSPQGIDFGGSVTWKVTGGNGFSAFTRSTGQGFPSIDSISSSTSNISSSSAYTLTTSSIGSSDSVIFQIAGSKGSKLVTLPSNSNQYTFSASDMAAIGAGTAVLQIAPYNLVNFTEGGKNIYYINETVISKVVNIQ